MEENSSRKKNQIINGGLVVVEEELRGDDDHANNNTPFHVSKEEEEEDVESLKKRISGHPLYGLLIQAHLNCLKVGLGEVEDLEVVTTNGANQVDDPAANNELTIKSNISTSSPDLDHFMEGYCMALRKLKEAIEEPVEETASFINAMYIQLRDLDTNGSCGPPQNS